MRCGISCASLCFAAVSAVRRIGAAPVASRARGCLGAATLLYGMVVPHCLISLISTQAAWRTQIAPAIGRAYWHLGEEGTVLDLMLAIRADEANHRDVNHLVPGRVEIKTSRRWRGGRRDDPG